MRGRQDHAIESCEDPMRKICISTIMCIYVFILLCTTGAPPIFGETPQPIRWALSASTRDSLPPKGGASVTSHLHASIQEGWHLYALNQEPGGPTATRI